MPAVAGIDSESTQPPVASGPFSYFTKSTQLNADEATRAVRGQTLGYVGVRFHKTLALLCRDCHEGMTAGTNAWTPKGFGREGYVQAVYSCEQRKPNAQGRCLVCGRDVIGEVAGG